MAGSAPSAFALAGPSDQGTAPLHGYNVFLGSQGVTSTKGRSFVMVGLSQDVEGGDPYARLLQIARLRSDWDGRGAPEPSAISVIRALEVVAAMEDTPSATFDRLIPDANGGIGFVFLGEKPGERYASIDCSNSGQMMLVLVDRRKRSHVVRELEAERQALSDAFAEIDAFLET